MAILAQDSFNRANNTTTLGVADTGQVWRSDVSQTWGIQNNMARPYTPAYDNPMYIDVGRSDNLAYQITISQYHEAHQIIWRYVSAGNFIMLEGNIIYLMLNGDFTALGVPITTMANGVTVRIEVEGNQNRIYINGTLNQTITNNNHMNGTKFGFCSEELTPRFDNLLIETIGDEEEPPTDEEFGHDILLKKGLRRDLSILDEGELAFCTDTKEVFIGTDEGNFLILAQVGEPDGEDGDYDNIIYPNTLVTTQGKNFIDYNKGAQTLKISTNHGLTYDKTMSIASIGVIKFIHVFDNGNVLICNHNKAFVTTDFVTYTESTLKDINGNTVTMTGRDIFSTAAHDPFTQTVNGMEILVWGNYSIDQDSQFTKIQVWYTVDNGHTIKTAYKFRPTAGGSGSNFARHVHAVIQNPKDGSFWVMTGDHFDGAESRHLMRGVYNTSNDTWSWTTIGSGEPFKWCTATIVGDYIYWAWDTPTGGFKMALLSEVGDITKHISLDIPTNDALNIYSSPRGELVFNNYHYNGQEDGNRVWYSADRKTFHQISVPFVDGSNPRTTVYDSFRFTSRGKISAGISDDSKGILSDWELTPRQFIDDHIKNAGHPDAFKPIASGEILTAGEVSSVTSSRTSNSITLNWSNPPTGYLGHVRILRNGAILRNHILGDTFTDTGLSSGTSYTYTIQTVDIKGVVSVGIQQTIATT